MKINSFYRQNVFAFWTSLIYVFLGGLVACSLYPNDTLNGNWFIWGWMVTFPVNIFSCSYRMFASTDYFPVFIIQSIIFISTFYFISKLFEHSRKL